MDALHFENVYLHCSPVIKAGSLYSNEIAWMMAREDQLEILVEQALSAFETGAEFAHVLSCQRVSDGQKLLGLAFAKTIDDAIEIIEALERDGVVEDVLFAGQNTSARPVKFLRSGQNREQLLAALRLLTFRLPSHNTNPHRRIIAQSDTSSQSARHYQEL